MDRMLAYRVKVEKRCPDQGTGEHEVNIRGADRGEVEEDLVEAGDRSFVTTVEDRDTTYKTAQT